MPSSLVRIARCEKLIAIAAVFLAAASAVRAQGAPDPTLESAKRIFRSAIAPAKEGPLSRNADASRIITALRTSKDKDLIPLFDKIRQSKFQENQIFAMVASSILLKDAAALDAGAGRAGEVAAGVSGAGVDFELLFACKDSELAGSAVATLIDSEVLSQDQLKRVVTQAPEPIQRALAALGLTHKHKLEDPLMKSAVMELLKDKDRIVRYYAATTLLASADTADINTGLATLKDLSSEHILREAVVQAAMLVRVQTEKINVAVPWATQIAGDEAFDEGLRYTALSTLLTLGAGGGTDGPAILGDMIQKQRDTIQQVKLGLIALNYPEQLKPQMLKPLVESKSRLAKSIGTLAQKAASKTDVTQSLVALIKEGDPIVLDWSLAYSDQLDEDRRVTIRTALVTQATIVDNARDRDYERAAIAAEHMLDQDGMAGRKTIASLLRSDNRAVVEATLAGIYRSNAKNQSELVSPVWDGLTKSTSTETAANYAALILSREGHKETLNWLPGMVVGGTVQGPGFRALASWYYAKLKGQASAVLAYAAAD